MNDQTQDPSTDDIEDDEEFESIADYHRMAAHHFTAAARHHMAAAAADEEGDSETVARHAFLAYRHQLSAAQYAEIAVMDDDSLEDEFAAEEDGEAEDAEQAKS